MLDHKNITQAQWEDYYRVAALLDSVVCSDVAGLKKIWVENYDTILKLADEGGLLLYNELVARKDYYKKLHKEGKMEWYHKQRLKAKVSVAYCNVWRIQLQKLTSMFEAAGDEDYIFLIDSLRKRVFEFEEAKKVLDNMKNKIELDVHEQGYQLIERREDGSEVVLGNFKDLITAEGELNEYLLAEMRKDPRQFSFDAEK